MIRILHHQAGFSQLQALVREVPQPWHLLHEPNHHARFSDDDDDDYDDDDGNDGDGGECTW